MFLFLHIVFTLWEEMKGMVHGLVKKINSSMTERLSGRMENEFGKVIKVNLFFCA